MSLLDRKNRLNQKINDLKVDIQYMLDKKSSLHNIEQISKLESDKKEKILLLTKFHDDLKIINKDIRKLQQTENELIKVSRTLDSLEFHNAKRKKTETAIDKAKQEKEMRENAKDKYLLHLKKQNEYYELDPVELPGILFLHDSIIQEYGTCPYVKIEYVFDETHDSN